MNEGFPYEIFSNIASIILLGILGYRYLQYKKNLDVVKGLRRGKDEGELTQDDIHFIKTNFREYKEQVAKSVQSTRLANPIFILIVALVVFSFPFKEALVHLNIVVVAFLFMQVDKLHKTNIFNYLNSLRREIKKEEEAKGDK